VPAVVGFGAAAASIIDQGDTLATEATRARAQTERVAKAASEGDFRAGARVVGDPRHRLPHVICPGMAQVEAEPVLLGLDRAGVAVHSGSSCASESLEPSPVLEAMGVEASQSLRVSVGWSTTDADIDALLAALPPILDRLLDLRS
jgi:cysteine desulfurase